jgi:Ca-activated chloride channel homolog
MFMYIAPIEYFRDQDQNTQHETRSKLFITLEVVKKVLDHLKPYDRLAIVAFDNSTSIIQTMKRFNEINIENLKIRLASIYPAGGTNMDDALKCSGCLMQATGSITNREYDNRILFLTDAQPNRDDSSQKNFCTHIEQLAQQRIFTTFIGIGIDLNTQLIDAITKQRGANYFSVDDSEKFIQLLDKDFDLIITPLVFDVKLKFNSDIFEIENVFGSPEWTDTKHVELIKINTLFPSRTDDGNRIRGGIVLVKLKAKATFQKLSDSSINLCMSYEDRLGSIYEEKQSIIIHKRNESNYANLGIRKAILLVNYINVLKKWVNHERKSSFETQHGLVGLNEPNTLHHNGWERRSMKLNVSQQSRNHLEKFLAYFELEMMILSDEGLHRERNLLRKLIDNWH